MRRRTLLTCFLLLFSLAATANIRTAVASSGFLVTEVQVGIDHAKKEFIELHNSLDTALDVNGWRVEFLKVDYASGLQDPPTRHLAILEGEVPAGGFLLLKNPEHPNPLELLALSASDFATAGLSSGALAGTGGYIRIVAVGENDELSLVDCIRWGGTASSTLEGCMRAPSAHGSDDSSLQRVFVDGTYDASYGLLNIEPVTPGSLHNITAPDPPIVEEEEEVPDEPPVVLPDEEPVAPDYTPNCNGIIFSEFLPNPSGTDAGREFIELHNPSGDEVNLKGCSIELSAATDRYTFETDTFMASDEYLALYDSETSITLPNAAGGTLIFVQSEIELQTQSYPADLGDDKAWALIDGSWQETALSTPGFLNQYLVDSEVGQEENELEPCPEGKYRSPDTNRCRNVVSATIGLTSCAAGQERNPLTNRCRATTASTPSLAPCAAGQERNLETNRCRSVLAAKSVLAECPEGQERNSETNRCRRVVANTLERQIDPVDQPPPNFGFAIGGLSAATLGYGAFEYRHDFRNWWRKIRRRS